MTARPAFRTVEGADSPNEGIAMSTPRAMTVSGESDGLAEARKRLLADLPVTDRRLEIAGVSTAVLEGGSGPPIVLLHGPGEFAAISMRVIPDLVTTQRVIAPDLPGHGASMVTDGPLDADGVLAWLDHLVQRTCESPPVLVGRTLGGAIAAHYASDHPDRVARLVLVDTFGLEQFEPAPEFGLALHGFMAAPSVRTYVALMGQCSFDVDGLRQQIGRHWDPMATYAVDLAATASVQAAIEAMMRDFAVPIPPDDLERITVPTLLIWGRHDLVTSLRVAEAASARYGWPLHVLERAADDPCLDQPEAFMAVLRNALGDLS
jgi:pimeloyl-ACP methyl ester carboxylesterase